MPKKQSASDKIKEENFNLKVRVYFENLEDLKDELDAIGKLREWVRDKKKDNEFLDYMNEFSKRNEELMDLVEKMTLENEAELSSKYRAKHLILKDLVQKIAKV